MQVDPEAGTEVRFVQDVRQRSLSQRHAVSQEQGMREIRRHVLDVMRHNHERRDRAITDVYLWPGSVLIKQEIQGGGTAEIEPAGNSAP